MRLIRVFPRRTAATPIDDMVYFDGPPLFLPEANEVHISCAFTWDKGKSEGLADCWSIYYPNVKLGGPAFDDLGGDFTPGRYLKSGYVITSRGCNNHCWFCDAWKREGPIREIPITEGWNVLDNNLLQCSEDHIRAVFAMLKRQPHKAEFTGGLEAALLRDWHIDLLLDLNPRQIFFAYDRKCDGDPLYEASLKLQNAGLIKPTSHVVRCYVLIGYPKDTIEKARNRLKAIMDLGMTPMAMLWRGGDDSPDLRWRRFQRQWARPQIIHAARPRGVQ